MKLTVEPLASFADAESTWEQLLAIDPHATFFSTTPWLRTWWMHHGAGRQMLLLAVKAADESVGFAPLMLEPVPGGQAVLFLGSGLSDYADILADERKTDRRAVVCALLDYLAEHYGGALFDLQEIPEHSPTLPLIKEWLQERQCPFVETEQDICPTIALPDTAEEYHKQLKKSFLQDLRRGDRRLREKGNLTLVDHVAPHNGDWTQLKDQLSDLQSQRMRTKGEVPLWKGPLGGFVKDVLKAANDADALRLTGLYLDGKLIAYELCFLHRTTIFAWSRAFDEEYRNTGPGKIALLHLLETGIAQGYRVFDLLRGEEPYKELWTNGRVVNRRVVFVVRPSLGVQLLFKWRTDWRPTLQKSDTLRKLNRFLKSRRGG